ncbi:Hsp20/alpha crystallin family protein [Deferribacterales bacterium Es71-Z0220]|jgi:HSP20 family protein|uniref:Hsp20/alpha crystallin family protein n=1 Tax=Deferrivibrio essentukiensis TaxID=2880922 RepID=UPI001F5FFC9B|nr:Hsp20/alpha crystallin family protein [Deferrivibrio essentukiensis]MBZ4647073.1 heat shock protein Hsp20 [Clostridia bacterium]MCB4205470.1 Hsp20/alpha crystallin family protein [Deferrivibrio essentukiensis]
MLERWRKKSVSPLRDVFDLQEEVNRLFDDFFLPSAQVRDFPFMPHVDIAENNSQIKVKADLPGVTEKDIELTLENNILTIKGKREEEKETKEDNYYSRERVYGTFMRQVQIPKRVNTDSVKAKFKNGVLEVVMDKAEEEKSKKIAIQAE